MARKNKNKGKGKQTASVKSTTKAPTVVSTKPTTVVTKKRTEVKTIFKPTLVLSKILLDKIDYLHKKVEKDTEWSAVLLYSNKEGSVDDPNNWVISVDDCILMDIGNSVYTEYDMEADDAYATEKWMDHLEHKNGKMGHLHTHHSMACYFSGTDMTELHDNAPNHNYYLSLIVNYRDVSQWCAKVAICGTQERTGEIITTTTWVGAAGVQTKKASEPVKSTEEMLYLMDCKIECEEANVPEGLEERITELEKANAAKAVKSWGGNLGYSYHNRGVNTGGTTLPSNHKPYAPTADVIDRMPIDTDGDDIDWDDWNGTGHVVKQSSHMTLSNNKTIKQETSATEAFSPGKVVPMFIKLLQDDMDSSDTLETVLSDLEVVPDDHLYEYILGMADDFKEHFQKFYSMELTNLHYHAIAVSLFDALVPYERFNAFDAIDVLLTSYLLAEGEFSPVVIKTMTGLAAEYQVCMEEKEV